MRSVTLDYRRKKRRDPSHLQGIDRSSKEGESSYYQSSIRHTKRPVYVGLFSVV
jgi:hypothetical protein